MRIVRLSVGLFVVMTALMTTIVFSQQRTFPENWSVVFQAAEHLYFALRLQDQRLERIAGADNPLSPYGLMYGVDCAPDGEHIYFTATDDGIYRLNIHEGLGYEQEIISFPDLSSMYHLRLSPDGEKIAFTAEDAFSSPNDIYVLDLQTLDFERITDTYRSVNGISWSPNGEQIAFSYSYNSGVDKFTAGIGRVNVDGSDYTILVEEEGHIGYSSVDWSPDGELLVFYSYTQTTSHIFIMRPDGGDLQQLTSDNGYYIHPRWSPDGQWISVSAAWGDAFLQIYLMKPDGSDLYPITFDLPNIGYYGDVFNSCWLNAQE